jgi:hypothetical protein
MEWTDGECVCSIHMRMVSRFVIKLLDKPRGSNNYLICAGIGYA